MQNILTITRSAGSDLSAKQFFAVKATADGGCDLAGANERVLGVLTNDPKTAGAAAVQVAGVARVVAGGAFAAGDYLKADAAGKAVKQTGEAAGTLVEVFAVALEAAAADGDQVEILLARAVVNNAAT